MQFHDANLRSASYFIAEMQAQCPRCGRLSPVLALALPPKHETLVDGEWRTVDANAFIFYVVSLPTSVSQLLIEHSADFIQTSCADPAESQWANRCSHCASMFSDDDLHCEPGGFMPSDALEARAISLTHVRQDFSALAAGHAPDPEFFSSMRLR